MNEVTKIHLGRQAFTISAEAYKDLRNYLDDIKKQVKDGSVVDEIELRMAELLDERGVSGEKVILPADVDFLKEQLGNPADFKEDDDKDDEPAAGEKTVEGKRLFRDTDGAILAGVASGLSKYLGVDVILIRLLFIIGLFTGGWGILLYIVLWLLVPEAKTSSDRLQMVGKPVTIDSLKEVVERADVKGAAQRANNSLAGPINTFFGVVLKVIGIVLIFLGLSALFGLLTLASYVVLHNGSLLQDNIFPIGLKEHLFSYISLFVVALASLFVVLFGMAMFLRRWPIRAWITGTLIGLACIGLAAGSALGADIFPQVRDRYNANVHTTVRLVQPFDSVNVVGGDGVDVEYQQAANYSVSFKYYDHPDLSNIKTTVNNGALVVDSQQFDPHRFCQDICIPETYDMVITVNSPNALQLINKVGGLPVIPPPPSAPVYKP